VTSLIIIFDLFWLVTLTTNLTVSKMTIPLFCVHRMHIIGDTKPQIFNNILVWWLSGPSHAMNVIVSTWILLLCAFGEHRKYWGRLLLSTLCIPIVQREITQIHLGPPSCFSRLLMRQRYIFIYIWAYKVSICLFHKYYTNKKY
jgi:hypothetical protein